MKPIRGRTRVLDAPKASTARVGASIHNRFDLEVLDAATGAVKQRARGYNVICNQLWGRLLTPSTFFNYIHYGTGSGTPSAADTSLFTFLGCGQPNAAEDVWDIEHDHEQWTSVTRKIQLAPETAVGAVLTEVGIGYSTAAGSLCTHAALQDMNGNPISITKTDTDVINIYATVFGHWTASPGCTVCGAFESEGIAPGGTFWRYLFGFGDSLMGGSWYASDAAGGIVSRGYMLGGRSYRLQPTYGYDKAGKVITVAFPRLDVNSANFSGLRCVQYFVATLAQGSYPTVDYCKPALSIGFPCDGVAESVITNEAIGTGDGSAVDFKTAFPDISSVSVYVDGVIQSGVTVDLGSPCRTTDMGIFFKQVKRGRSPSQGTYLLTGGARPGFTKAALSFLRTPTTPSGSYPDNSAQE